VRSEPPGESPDQPDELARLPHGRHGLPPEFIERNQRARLLNALVQIVAERGYNDTTITRVIEGAGVLFREAVAINRRAAALMGINLRLVGLMAYVGAGIVTAVVGVLVAGGSGAFYQMGLPLAIQGFTALVIGGVGRVEGALLGGLILGFTEAFAARYLPIPSGLIQGVPLVLLILFLLVRPTGLLRAKEARL